MKSKSNGCKPKGSQPHSAQPRPGRVNQGGLVIRPKPLSYPMYLSEPASRRFRQLEDNQTIEAVFDFLNQVDQLQAMMAATQAGRPAMEGVIETIEAQFPRCGDFDLLETYRHRQVLGSMIRHIMGHYGFPPGKAKPLKKGRFVKTAIVYGWPGYQ